MSKASSDLTPFLARKGEETISEGHPQTPGPDPIGAHPFLPQPARHLGIFALAQGRQSPEARTLDSLDASCAMIGRIVGGGCGAMEQPSQILVRGLTHVYESGRQPLTALADVDLEATEADFLSVIGPSGGGKTTLLRVISGLLEPTAGTIQVDGTSPREAQRRKAIGFVSQAPSLLPWRTVFQNILLPLQLNPRDNGMDAGEPERLLEAVGLAEFRSYYPHQLSAGMKQRVALARTLVMDPAVLLMDEPLGALDEITRIAMRYELLRLWEHSRKTVVLVTHSIPEAVMMSDSVVVLSSRPGRVLQRVSIDLPRPRLESLEHTTRFLDYTREIKEILSMGALFGTSPAEAHAQTRV